MDPTLLLLRWAHVLAAIVAMGGLVFARFALVPALSEFDQDARDRIHDAIRRRWLPWVIGAITVLLASGLANFLLFNARVRSEEWAEGMWMRQHSYHALFGAKFLLAMVAFYFASALVGRGQGTQWVRDDRAKWLSVTLGLSLAVVMLSGWMRQLHTGPNVQPHGVRLEGFGGDDGSGAGQAADLRYRDGSAGARFREPSADGASQEPAQAPDTAPAPDPAPPP